MKGMKVWKNNEGGGRLDGVYLQAFKYLKS